MTAAADWTGRIGDVWAAEWRRTDRSFAHLAPHLHAAILAAAGDARRVLDIGCGAGATSLALAAARPDLAITGVDLSPALVAAAAARTRGVTFEAGDAIAAAERLAPDLCISRHGVMFFPDPREAFARLARVADRLVFSCFAARAANAWAAESIAALGGPDAAATGPGPFAFADPAHVADLLAGAGWFARHERIDFAYIAGQGADPVADAVDFLTRIGPAASLLRDAASAERDGLRDRLAAVCDRRRTGDTVAFPAAAWIWSAQQPGSAHA